MKIVIVILGLYFSSMVLEAKCTKYLKTCLQKSHVTKEYELSLSDKTFKAFHPSQRYFGLPKIAYVTRKFTYRKFKEIKELFNEKPVYVVKSPSGELWIVDAHHHSLTAFKNLSTLASRFGGDLKSIKLKVVELADFTGETKSSFHQYLKDNKYTYLRQGEDLSDLPAHISDLIPDYERGLAYLLIKGKVISKDDTPFVEFYIADILRKHLRPNKEYLWDEDELIRYSRFVQENQILFSNIPGIKIKKVSDKKLTNKIKKYLESLAWYMAN